MAIRVVVSGAFGHMGRMTCDTLSNDPAFDLVGLATREDDLESVIVSSNAEIVIDFTTPESVFANAMTIIEANARPVIGTTGLSAEQRAVLAARCEEKGLGGMIVPNFSIAAVLMMQFAAQAARYLPSAAIVETHHVQKKDAPSGTALKTAEAMAACREPNIVPESALVPGVLGGMHEGVPIHSLRISGVLARQEVVLGSFGETLRIVQESTDRRCFMPGVLLACRKVLQLQSLVYGLDLL
ncbi:MAG: 4-hydroxy-tetrahydrodipicolinate reductase [Legionellaceae bacterium]|nr:4-hydroxy-tetrahydrodipicolinate reductase [Legionellaceae bacterium]